MAKPKQGLGERESEFMDILMENDSIRKQPHLEEDMGPVEEFVDKLLASKLGPDEDEDAEEFDGEDTEE